MHLLMVDVLKMESKKHDLLTLYKIIFINIKDLCLCYIYIHNR